jgi:uncharacterized membrane protein YjfL (UPF0719 family)
MKDLLMQYLITAGWGITGAITMAIALPLLLWVFSKFTPLNDWEEIKKGNMGVAIILAALIIAFAVVMGFAIMPASA